MARRLDKESQQMLHYQQAMGAAFRETAQQLKQQKKTLFWQNIKYHKLKAEGEELDLLLKLCHSFRPPFWEKAKKRSLTKLENYYNAGLMELLSPEEENTVDKYMNRAKVKVREEERNAVWSAEILAEVKKYIQLMEKKLQVKTVEFGKQYTEMSKLRLELSSLQTRLNAFEAMCSRLDAMHDDISFKTQKLVKISSSANSKKQEAQIKTVSLNERIEHNELLYRFEMNELDRNSFNTINFEEFVSVLLQEREGYSLGIYLKKNEKELAARRRQLTEYMKEFSRIKDASGISDMRTTINLFQQQKSNNFSMFRYLVEVHSEIGRINAEMNSLTPLIDKNQEKYLYKHAMLRKTLHEVQEMGKQETARTEREMEIAKRTKARMENFKKDLMEIMTLLGADVTALAGVTDCVASKELILNCIVNIFNKMNELVKLKIYLDRYKPSQKVNNTVVYRKHHLSVTPPVITSLD
ncbi:uncharacterized protein LOC115224478 [Argonauta hians]